MFGMFKYKPSPFCLLDEIDAPLDDANIGRFVEMLRGMQQHTQFIVITHNRKTMEIADRLYGVTMEEPGRVEADFGPVELSCAALAYVQVEEVLYGLHVCSARLAAVPLALAVTACDMHLGNLAGRATDEWTHTYPLTAGGQVRIGNTNGKMEIEGVDGSTVEIRAERIAKGVTDTAARDLLPRIEIKEDVRPDRVSVETARISGIMFGAGFEVRYHVRAPKNAVIDVSNTNGLVTVSGISGRVVARTTNGGVTGKGLSGGVDARATNGGVNIELASVGSDRIALRTTNGGVTLTVPEYGKGRRLGDVYERRHQRLRREARGVGAVAPSPRRQVNGGGTPIELHTTNGGVRLRSKAPEDESRSDSDAEPATVPKTLKSRQ